MNKRELIKIASEQSGVPQQTLHYCLEILLENMKNVLNSGQCITLSNFGTFRVKNQEERYIRNPKTNELVHVDSKLKISFKTSPGMYLKK